MLNQIILGSTIFSNISEYFSDDIKLMVTRENQIFRTLDFSGFIINFFFCLNKNKLAD